MISVQTIINFHNYTTNLSGLKLKYDYNQDFYYFALQTLVSELLLQLMLVFTNYTREQRFPHIFMIPHYLL